MTRFLLGRCLGLVLTLLAASAVVFLVLDVLPGDVAQVMLGPDADPQAVQALAAQLGLDRPAWVRYGQWLLGLLQGELGMSQAYGVPVAGLLAERLVLTVPLTLLAMALAGGMALLAAYTASTRHGSAATSLSSFLAEQIFASQELSTVQTDEAGMAGHASWLAGYRTGLEVERRAGEVLA